MYGIKVKRNAIVCVSSQPFSNLKKNDWVLIDRTKSKIAGQAVKIKDGKWRIQISVLRCQVGLWTGGLTNVLHLDARFPDTCGYLDMYSVNESYSH